MSRDSFAEMETRIEHGARQFGRIWTGIAVLTSAIEGFLMSPKVDPTARNPLDLAIRDAALGEFRVQLSVAQITFEWMQMGEWDDPIQELALQRLNSVESPMYEDVVIKCNQARSTLLRLFLGSGLLLESCETSFSWWATDEYSRIGDMEYFVKRERRQVHEILSGAPWLLYFSDEPPLLDVGNSPLSRRAMAGDDDDTLPPHSSYKSTPPVDMKSVSVWRRLLLLGVSQWRICGSGSSIRRCSRQQMRTGRPTGTCLASSPACCDCMAVLRPSRPVSSISRSSWARMPPTARSTSVCSWLC